MRLTVIVAVCALLGVTVSACDSPEEEAAKFASRGTALFEQGDLAKASIEFRNALKSDPLAVTPLLYLAKIAEHNGELPVAFSHYSTAADQDPGNVEAQTGAGQLALLFGQTDNAIYRADKLIALRPEATDGYLLKAGAEIARNNGTAAEKVLLKVLEMAPGNVEAIGMLAEIEGRRKNYGKAAALLDQGLATAPENIELMGAKLSLARLLEDEAAEMDLLRRLHAAQPDDVGYTDSLASALLKAGSPDAAREIYAKAIAAKPDNQAMIAKYVIFLENNVGMDAALAAVAALPDTAMPRAARLQLVAQMAVKTGDLAAAEQNFRALGADGSPLADRLAAQAGLAQVALARGDAAEAKAITNGILKEEPGNETALLMRAAIALTQRQFDIAITDTRSVLRVHPDSAPALALLARTYLTMGDRTLAVQALRDLIRADSTDAEAHLELARLLSANAPQEALTLLDRAILLRPGAFELQAQKAQYLVRLGERDKAEAIGNKLVALPGQGAVGREILGLVAMARNDLDEAQRQFNEALAAGASFTEIGPRLVQSQINLGRIAEAESLLRSRIAQHPDETAAYLLLATLKRHAGAVAEADELLQQAIAARPSDPASYVAMSQFMIQQGYYEDAMRLMAIMADRFPDSEQVQAIAAAAAESGGDLVSARTRYEKVLARWPENTIAANNLAALIADTADADAAQLARARSLAERFRKSENAQQLDTLGWVMLRQGEIQEATVLLAAAAELLPFNQQILYHYAAALERKGLHDLARSTLSRALSGDPTYRGVENARQLARSLNQ